MLLAVKKEEGSIPGGGFHYLTMPRPMENAREAVLWQAMGYIILEVDDLMGKRVIEDAQKALSHQWEVAQLVNGSLNKRVDGQASDVP